jgi:HSP20 family protein
VLIIAELAGVPAGRIDVKVEGTSLVISGDRPEPSSEANRAFCQMEISYGPFERTIQLPAQVDAESARASYEDGFLQVRLPKLKGRSRKEVDIDVSTE